MNQISRLIHARAPLGCLGIVCMPVPIGSRRGLFRLHFVLSMILNILKWVHGFLYIFFLALLKQNLHLGWYLQMHRVPLVKLMITHKPVLPLDQVPRQYPPRSSQCQPRWFSFLCNPREFCIPDCGNNSLQTSQCLWLKKIICHGEEDFYILTHIRKLHSEQPQRGRNEIWARQLKITHNPQMLFIFKGAHGMCNL